MVTDNTKNLKQRIAELESLLNVEQELCNVIDPLGLYSTIEELIKIKLKISDLAIFICHHKDEKFELVFRNSGRRFEDFVFSFDNSNGPLWKKILKNEPFSVIDIAGNPIFSELSENFLLSKLNSELWVPLVVRERVIGLLTMGGKINGQPFDEFELNYIKHIAANASIRLNTYNLYEKRQKEKKELDKVLKNLSMLYNISKAMTYDRNLNSLLKYILEQAIEITKAEKGSIMLYDPDTRQLAISVIEGLDDKAHQDKINNQQIKCKSFKPGEGVAGQVFQTKKPIVLNKVQDDDKFVESDSSFARSIVCIPMIFYNEVIGVINVTNKRDESHFTEVDVEMLKAITDQAAVAISKAQFREMAVTDFLTGLYIRRYFMVKLQDELHRADRYSKAFSIVMADIDKFKSINDTYGHTAGDEVLKEVGKFFQKNIRQADVIARYGGEEFVILFPETAKNVAYVLSERLREGFSKIKIDNLPRLTISLGVASFPEDGKDVGDLIKNADIALYSAKQQGRNKVVKFNLS